MILNSDYAKTFWSSQPQKCWYSICPRNEFHGAWILMSLLCPQGWKLKLNSTSYCVWLHSITLNKQIRHIKKIWFVFTCMASGSVGSACIVCRLIVDNVWKLCVISPNILSTMSTPGPLGLFYIESYPFQEFFSGVWFFLWGENLGCN